MRAETRMGMGISTHYSGLYSKTVRTLSLFLSDDMRCTKDGSCRHLPTSHNPQEWVNSAYKEVL